MKLGVSYNLFDGEELLAYSIRPIRAHVDHISVVYQTVSNHGNMVDVPLEQILQALMKENLIDELYCYEPDLSVEPCINETNKRNIGLQLAKNCGCTHFINMDVDEFYDTEEFRYCKNFIENNAIGCSAAKIVSYIKEPIYRIEGVRDAYVSFICALDNSSEIVLNTQFPVLVDPTRRFSGDQKFHLFDEQTIVMHHMGLVRRNLEKKFANSSSKAIDALRKHTLAWKAGNNFKYTDDGQELNVLEVDNKFNIDINSDPIKVLALDKSTKTVLLTNHHLIQFAGSEITTLETALTFKSLGYQVTVATFEYDLPMKAEFEKHGIVVFNALYNIPPDKEYDLAWCHHSPVLTHLVVTGVKLKHVVLRTMSPFVALEAIPIYADDLDMVLAHSAETAERYYSDGFIPKDNIKLLENAVPEHFFHQAKASQQEHLTKIAIVSNHAVPELLEMIDILKKQFISVDIIGQNGQPKLITPEVLLPYDVVITIGKTVQYCMAMNIPVYCYDHFGGPGYLTNANFEKARHYNFSGRCCKRHIPASELASEIQQGRDSSIETLKHLHSIAAREFNLNTNIQAVLKILSARKSNRVFYDHNLTKDFNKYLVYNKYYTDALLRSDRRMRALSGCRDRLKLMSQQVSNLAETKIALAAADKLIAEKKMALAAAAKSLAQKDSQILKLRAELYTVYISRSWRSTVLFRKCGRQIRLASERLHNPKIRVAIKNAYFLLPSFVRNSRAVESLKNRFKSNEKTV